MSTKLRSIPWLTTESIKMLEDFLVGGDKKVLEFGMGASTVWLSKRCKMLVSFEHDSSWFCEVSSHITDNDNCQLNLCESPLIYDVSDHLVNPYFHRVDSFPDEMFDVVLIDGRDRVECFKHAEPKLKKGGLLMLDNSEREYYSEIFQLYSDKEKYDFVQRTPDAEGFNYDNWTTTCWIK